MKYEYLGKVKWGCRSRALEGRKKDLVETQDKEEKDCKWRWR